MVLQKLIAVRKAKIGSQKVMASKCAMDQTTYSRKENGISPTTEEEWQRFANVLDVNVEDIKEVPKMVFHNENCTFQDNSQLNQGTQYISVHQSLLDATIKYNAKLEMENAKLEEANKTLQEKISLLEEEIMRKRI